MSAPTVHSAPPMPDGADLLRDVRAALSDYVVMPSPAAAIAVTLWIAVTHCLQAFEHATRLVVKSPEKRCGKSRLLEILFATCHKPVMTGNITEAALFRSIGDDPPTLLLDEADTMFGTRIKAEQNEGLRGLLNAGYRRGLTTIRTVGPQHTPTAFPTFAMAALAGIGSMPDTIEDRAVVIRMRRRLAGESVRPYRFRRDQPRLVELRDRLAIWAESVLDHLSDAEPQLPFDDRAADTWEPLIAVADAAGGEWPALARSAAVSLVNASVEQDSDANLNTRLLHDIHSIFHATQKDFIGSIELVAKLTQLADSPWADLALTTNKLAKRMSGYGVKPKANTTATLRGYALAAFTDTFERYLTAGSTDPSEPVKPPEGAGAESDGCLSSDTSKCQSAYDPSGDPPREHEDLTVSDGSDIHPGTMPDNETADLDNTGDNHDSQTAQNTENTEDTEDTEDTDSPTETSETTEDAEDIDTGTGTGTEKFEAELTKVDADLPDQGPNTVSALAFTVDDDEVGSGNGMCKVCEKRNCYKKETIARGVCAGCWPSYEADGTAV